MCVVVWEKRFKIEKGDSVPQDDWYISYGHLVQTSLVISWKMLKAFISALQRDGSTTGLGSAQIRCGWTERPLGLLGHNQMFYLAAVNPQCTPRITRCEQKKGRQCFELTFSRKYVFFASVWSVSWSWPKQPWEVAVCGTQWAIERPRKIEPKPWRIENCRKSLEK